MDYLKYYENQAGNGTPVFRGMHMQRGYGLGSIFRSFARWVVPLFKTHALPYLKEGAKTLGNEAIKTVAHVANDSLEDKNITNSLQQRTQEAINSIANKVEHKLQKGSGIKRKRFAFKKKAKAKRTKQDIFDHEFTS